MIINKDGYKFDYTHDEENQLMCKEYNKLIKRLGKVRLLSTFPSLFMMRFYHSHIPLYLFEPKNKSQIDKVMEVFKELSPYRASQAEFRLNEKYLIFFTDHSGFFEMHTTKTSHLLDDINILLEFKNLIYGELNKVLF